MWMHSHTGILSNGGAGSEVLALNAKYFRLTIKAGADSVLSGIVSVISSSPEAIPSAVLRCSTFLAALDQSEKCLFAIGLITFPRPYLTAYFCKRDEKSGSHHAKQPTLQTRVKFRQLL